jgi:hypothetical protein
MFEVELIARHTLERNFYRSELESPTNSITGRALRET